jgi:galactokinase
MTVPAAPRRFFAPGRLNVIGEHVDYCGGLVLPAAIQLGTTVEAQLTGGGLLEVALAGEVRRFGMGFAPAYHGWEGYVAGTAAVLAQHLGLSDPPGVRLAIEGKVPLGKGMSSSAALEVSVGLALWTLWAQAGVAPPVDRLALAKVAQQAEHRCVGTRCGLMDQYASVFGAEGHALLMDCRSETHEPIVVPDDLAFVLVDCSRAHALADAPYGARRADCEEAARQLGVEQLRDVAELDQLAGLSGNPLRRARHVVSEIARTRQAAQALRAGDAAALGALMVASHASLRDDMEVSCDELDGLQALALATPGVFGARMMGGGFGGMVIALVQAGDAQAIGAELAARWARTLGREAVSWFRCLPGAGARELA